jgi:hypothetical protein
MRHVAHFLEEQRVFTAFPPLNLVGHIVAQPDRLELLTNS